MGFSRFFIFSKVSYAHTQWFLNPLPTTSPATKNLQGEEVPVGGFSRYFNKLLSITPQKKKKKLLSITKENSETLIAIEMFCKNLGD